MKRLLFYIGCFFMCVSMFVVADDIIVGQVGEEPSNISFFTRAKQQAQAFNVKYLIDLAPFALVAKCYNDSPNLTMAVLGATMMVISLRNAYIQRSARRIVLKVKKFLKTLRVT